ncbi:hypothetical protein NDU88_000264 [Pleurodeles waltl]|uniref:Uncharacterized protein n=1 Tax=Pleurodeles waltl TaxID=8319 RepID=A0AAV7L9E9_PLEWA|nr:hypothetical protein NDU88_000264 [Pleurodeles waltl]
MACTHPTTVPWWPALALHQYLGGLHSLYTSILVACTRSTPVSWRPALALHQYLGGLRSLYTSTLAACTRSTTLPWWWPAHSLQPYPGGGLHISYNRTQVVACTFPSTVPWWPAHSLQPYPGSLHIPYNRTLVACALHQYPGGLHLLYNRTLAGCTCSTTWVLPYSRGCLLESSERVHCAPRTPLWCFGECAVELAFTFLNDAREIQ